MSDSNEGPIGFKPAVVVPAGVTVMKRGKTVAVGAPRARPATAAVAAVPRPATAAAAAVPRPATAAAAAVPVITQIKEAPPAFQIAEAVDDAPALQVSEVASAAASPEEAPATAGPEEAPATAQEVAAVAEEVAKLKTVLEPAPVSVVAVPITRPPPADAPLLSKAEFTPELKAKIRPKEEQFVEAKLPAGATGFRPLTASSFPDFIVQTYAQYSPYLLKILEGQSPDALADAEPDKDACKRRDPNKVETFYYQKFVRDYLSRGTPYRGLLVYHGLGSGKTCTSIAAAEALYWGGKKQIFVLTPATLSNNYRRELGKCGYFPLRRNNYWSFLKLREGGDPKTDPSYVWLTDQGLGLPPKLVLQQGGGWIPNPDKPTNWDTLSREAQESIRFQQQEHLNFRFKFIHYNGVVPQILSQLAAAGVAEGKSVFDDAVVIIDEIHNLVRTINGTQIGGKTVPQILERVEPREFTWSTPLARERPGFRYPRGYSLYRLLQNAVGAKIIALSATPMINYAQEMAILMNLVGGEQRVVEISLRGVSRDPGTEGRLRDWCKQRPDIDFFKIEEAADRSTVLTLTPVPFGYAKVVKDNFDLRGFVRGPRGADVRASRERNMDSWAVELMKELETATILKAGTGAEAEAAVAAARAAGPGTAVKSTAFKLLTYPMLPEDPKLFVPNFVDRNTLRIINGNILRARASGLISFYRGGSEELMPRTTVNSVVEVPMSDYMFQEYSRARKAELEMETPAQKEGEGAERKGQRGMTKAEVDLYTQATKTQQTGFLALSRAACNWVFPEDVPRPKVSLKDQQKLLGMEQDRLIAADLAADVDVDEPAGGAGGAAAAVAVPETVPPGEEAGAEISEAVLPDTAEATAAAQPTPLDAKLASMLGSLMSGLETKADDYLNKNLAVFSPKYATILAKIRASPGPVLVYSQFKTLEGLGIFAAALRAAPERYLPLDLEKDKATGEWKIPDELMTEEARARPRYVLYTGDQDLDKRRLLLQLYNADVAGLPPRLSAQCAQLLAGAPDNRDGRICRIFMITQSGAEGISLFNTRQVHIMEPYWNNVRLQQVIGRAIRLCSHMNLPWDDRTVEVYTYLSTFTAQQKVEGKEIMIADSAMTTDQIIFDIATKKQRLADGLFEIAQSAAVDCELHFHEHGKATQCFRFAEGRRPVFMYHPNWEKDLETAVRGATGAGV